MVMLMNRLDRLETLLAKALGVELDAEAPGSSSSSASNAQKRFSFTGVGGANGSGLHHDNSSFYSQFTPSVSALQANEGSGGVGGSRRNSRRSEIILPNGNHQSTISHSSSGESTVVSPVKRTALGEVLQSEKEVGEVVVVPAADNSEVPSGDSQTTLNEVRVVMPLESVEIPGPPTTATDVSEAHPTAPVSTTVVSGLDPLSPSTAGKVSLAIESMEKRIEAVRAASVTVLHAAHGSPVLPRKESFKQQLSSSLNGKSGGSSSSSIVGGERETVNSEEAEASKQSQHPFIDI